MFCHFTFNPEKDPAGFNNIICAQSGHHFSCCLFSSTLVQPLACLTWVLVMALNYCFSLLTFPCHRQSLIWVLLYPSSLRRPQWFLVKLDKKLTPLPQPMKIYLVSAYSTTHSSFTPFPDTSWFTPMSYLGGVSHTRLCRPDYIILNLLMKILFSCFFFFAAVISKILT